VSHVLASVARPGGGFAPAVNLGAFRAYPVAATLAPDGTGAVAWGASRGLNTRVLVRRLGADGTWAAAHEIGPGASVTGVALAAGMVAWTQRPLRNDHEVLRLAALPR
jgi:hypothetical protein